jgi:hypothetical protein
MTFAGGSAAALLVSAVGAAAFLTPVALAAWALVHWLR